MSVIWYPTPKMSPFTGMSGFGGGFQRFKSGAETFEVTTLRFTGNDNSGNSMRAFYFDSTVVTDTFFASSNNQITQYDSGQDGSYFPLCYDGVDSNSNKLDWKYGYIEFTFSGKSAANIDYSGTIGPNGSITVNGTTVGRNIDSGQTSPGGFTLYRIALADYL